MENTFFLNDRQQMFSECPPWVCHHAKTQWVQYSYCFLFLFLFFYFTILYWFCHTSTCIRHVFFKLLILCRSIADKQRCDGFRRTAKGLSHTYTCIHSLPNSPSTQAAVLFKCLNTLPQFLHEDHF